MAVTETELEQLAALIDRGLDKREREEVLARLAASDDDDLGVFLDMLEAAEALDPMAADAYADESDALDDEPVAPGLQVPRLADPVEAPEEPQAESTAPLGSGDRTVIPISGRRAGAPWWPALAAAVTAVAIGGSLWMRSRDDSLAGPTAYAALLRGGSGLPPQVRERPWSVDRGPGGAVPGLELQVRFGAALLDLQVEDPADAASRELSLLLRGTRGQGVQAELCRRAGDPRIPAAERWQARDECTATVTALLGDAVPFHLGAWAEAARIAAAGHDAGFFSARASRDALRQAAGLEGAPAAAAAAKRIQALLAAGSEPDWAQLLDASTALLGGLAEPEPRA
jgi:hypothetical protein